MTERYEGIKSRGPVVGDYIIIHSALCEWDGQIGEVVDVSADPSNDMPIMVKRPNFDMWPFAIWELELHSLEDEVYEGGWIDPRIISMRKP